jgi:lysyl-tRNA synthetase, class II
MDSNSFTDLTHNSLSSIEHQRDLRIAKIQPLMDLGQEPYAINSKRDFNLFFLAFWFRFVHNIGLEEVVSSVAPYSVEYFLYQVLFPKSALDRAEEMVRVKNFLKQSGLDPYDEKIMQAYDAEKISAAREHFPMLSQLNTDQKIDLLNAFLVYTVSTKTPKSAFVKNQTVTLVGRVKSKRVSGKIAFATVEDESLPAGFQFVFKSDDLVAKETFEMTYKEDDKSQLNWDNLHKGNIKVEVRAINQDEPHRLYTELKPGQIIEYKNLKTGEVFKKEVRTITKHESIAEAFGHKFDFKRVGVKDTSSTENIRKWYKENVVEGYLEKMETNGFVAIELGEYNNSLDFEGFKDLIDEGDYIQATGMLDLSRSGEPSMFVRSLQILTKALRPLPEKLEYKDVESRYLNRVVDFKSNTIDEDGLSVREMIRLKSHFWQIWRTELLRLDFLEVETPVFEQIPGGAEARPFKTFHNQLDQDVFLRISLELPLKRLIAGGFERVFEIGRIFRNEGASPQHLQEYTQMEFYWAYANYRDCMTFIQRVYRKLVSEVKGTLEMVDYNQNTINWGRWADGETDKTYETLNGWPMIPFFDVVRKYTGGTIDIEGKNLEELRVIAAENKIAYQPTDSISRLLDLIYKKAARPKILNPIFMILPPVELEPLAKRDSEFPNLTQRFQVVAGSAELGKGFSELNNPLDQRSRFEEQQAAKDAGDEEAQSMDEDYLEAMEYGMPPLTGFGISERLFSFILGKSIKESVTFPAVRGVEERR